MFVSSNEAVNYLIEYSEVSGISIDILLSAYLVLDDNLFFLLDLFQKQTIKFPVTKTLKSQFTVNKTCIELTSRKYKTSRGWCPVELLSVGDEVQVNNQIFVLKEPIRCLLGHYYLIHGGD